MDDAVRLIAFYLPQFHPIPENDAWWGRGFTEWTSVARARPLFRGHYQPHLPADLGFYDLRLPETREAQAALAAQYGLHGFCYYHYWFNGHRLLERPFTEVLQSGHPRLPFCLCWANENWTRRWDGEDSQILIAQEYSAEDDLAHIRALLPAFHDPRYIRVKGRPLFLVYRVNWLPDPQATAARWRAEAVRSGLPGLYLCTVSSLPQLHTDPAASGFDAAVEFQPDWQHVTADAVRPLWRRAVRRVRGRDPFCDNHVVPYQVRAEHAMRRPDPPFRLFPGVTPSWDNAARRKSGALIFTGSTPARYGAWLRQAIGACLRRHAGDERLVFINAWNEWAEGNHLEPDQKWGHAYLEATREALHAASMAGVAADETQAPRPSSSAGVEARRR
jgi:lipopolysaccharide biosynthesis protein